MAKQGQWLTLVDAMEQENHPLCSWISIVFTQLGNPVSFQWLNQKQSEMKEYLNQIEELETSSTLSTKEMLQVLKGAWDSVRRVYFRDYFLSEIKGSSSHPLNSFLSVLEQGIDSHESYLTIEKIWNDKVLPYCLSLGDDFANLARLSLSKVYTIEKNKYYDQRLSLEIQNDETNPFYPFVQFVSLNPVFDEELYQVFEEEVVRVETFIFEQNEQYQRRLLTALKPYHLKGKQAYYKQVVDGSSWEMVEADIKRHSEWRVTGTLLQDISLEVLKTDSDLLAVATQLQSTQLQREKEMGYFNFQWIQKEFEKRLRFLEKKVSLLNENQFAPWLKQMREAHGLSFRQLEQLSGVSSTYLHRLEMGARKSPSIPIAKKITQAFGVPFDTVAKFIDSEQESIEMTQEHELDLLKLLELKPLTLEGTPLTKKKRKILSELITLIHDKSFNPNQLSDTVNLLELIKLYQR